MKDCRRGCCITLVGVSPRMVCGSICVSSLQASTIFMFAHRAPFFLLLFFWPKMPARTRGSSQGIENQLRFLTSPSIRISSSKDVLFSQPAHSKHPLQHRRRRRCCRASLAVPRPLGAARTTLLSALPLALRGSFKMRSRKAVPTS